MASEKALAGRSKQSHRPIRSHSVVGSENNLFSASPRIPWPPAPFGRLRPGLSQPSQGPIFRGFAPPWGTRNPWFLRRRISIHRISCARQVLHRPPRLGRLWGAVIEALILGMSTAVATAEASNQLHRILSAPPASKVLQHYSGISSDRAPVWKSPGQSVGGRILQCFIKFSSFASKSTHRSCCLSSSRRGDVVLFVQIESCRIE